MDFVRQSSELSSDFPLETDIRQACEESDDFISLDQQNDSKFSNTGQISGSTADPNSSSGAQNDFPYTQPCDDQISQKNNLGQSSNRQSLVELPYSRGNPDFEIFSGDSSDSSQQKLDKEEANGQKRTFKGKCNSQQQGLHMPTDNSIQINKGESSENILPNSNASNISGQEFSASNQLKQMLDSYDHLFQNAETDLNHFQKEIAFLMNYLRFLDHQYPQYHNTFTKMLRIAQDDLGKFIQKPQKYEQNFDNIPKIDFSNICSGKELQIVNEDSNKLRNTNLQQWLNSLINEFTPQNKDQTHDSNSQISHQDTKQKSPQTPDYMKRRKEILYRCFLQLLSNLNPDLHTEVRDIMIKNSRPNMKKDSTKNLVNGTGKFANLEDSSRHILMWEMYNFFYSYSISGLEEYMKKAGISDVTNKKILQKFALLPDQIKALPGKVQVRSFLCADIQPIEQEFLELGFLTEEELQEDKNEKIQAYNQYQNNKQNKSQLTSNKIFETQNHN